MQTIERMIAAIDPDDVASYCKMESEFIPEELNVAIALGTVKQIGKRPDGERAFRLLHPKAFGAIKAIPPNQVLGTSPTTINM